MSSEIESSKNFDELYTEFYNARRINPGDENKELKEMFNDGKYKQLSERLKHVKISVVLEDMKKYITNEIVENLIPNISKNIKVIKNYDDDFIDPQEETKGGQ